MAQAGWYEGELKDYGISKNQKGGLQMWVIITVFFPTETEDMNNFCQLSTEKARAFAYQVAEACGWTGHDLSKVAEGPTGGALKVGKKVRVFVVKNDQDKGPAYRIKYINDPNAVANKVDAPEDLAVLRGYAAEVKASRIERGTNQTDEIPF